MAAALVSLLGPPASGKTTVGRWLADALGAPLLLEDYAGNPFLAAGFQGNADLRLPAQVWFLLSRIEQLCGHRWPRQGCLVSDYAYLQDRVYASLWLDGADWAAYETLARRMEPLVQPPRVLVHLDGPVEVLLGRIARRGRCYERTFTPEFLQRLRDEYHRLTARAEPPVIHVDIAQCDLASPAEQQRLLEQVRQMVE